DPAVRLEDPGGYFATLDQLLRPGARGLVLLGNDREPEDDAGPPVVGEATIRHEFGRLFDVLRLREFRFDAPPGGRRYLGWSCLLQRRPLRKAFPVGNDHQARQPLFNSPAPRGGHRAGPPTRA